MLKTINNSKEIIIYIKITLLGANNNKIELISCIIRTSCIYIYSSSISFRFLFSTNL